MLPEKAVAAVLCDVLKFNKKDITLAEKELYKKYGDFIRKQRSHNNKRKLYFAVPALLICPCVVTLLSLNHSVVEAGSPGNSATLTYEAFEDTLVYVTPSGQKFHKEGCRYVDKDTATEMTIEKALDKGYGAYKTCHPLDDRVYIY